MKKLLQQGLLSALVISITACGGGSSHSNIIATVASSSSLAVTSSSATSSSSAVAATIYTVSVDVPSSFETQTAAITGPQKIGQFFMPSAHADEVTTLTAANFAVVIVDLAGNVLERVALTDSDISKNSDGSWSLAVPGDPRLDCVIVADVTKPIVLAVDGNINQDGFVFAPTTAASVDIDVGSTAAYKNFIEELGGSGTFASLNIDPTDTLQIKAVENLVNTIQTVVADQALTGYSSVTEALAAIKSTVTDTVKQEVENVKKPASGTAVTLIRDEGGLFWFEGTDFSEIAYGGLVGAEEEVSYYFDGEAFVQDTDEESEPELVLSSEGWTTTSDRIKVTSFNEDGTVSLQDAAADGAKEVAEVTQVFDLAGRNIKEYLSANYTTKLLGKMANPETVFDAGAKGYRVQITNPTKSYWIHYQPGLEDGTCPWNSSQNANNVGGNCNLIMMHGATQSGASAPSDLSALFSEDVAPNTTGFVSVDLGGKATAGMLTVQLLNDAAKTERFYLQSWASGELELIGTGTWSELTLPGLTEDARVIHIQIPEEVSAIANSTDSTNGTTSASSRSIMSFSSQGVMSASSQDFISTSSKDAMSASSQTFMSASSQDAKSGSSVSATSASSLATQTGNTEGANSDNSRDESPDYYIVKQAGFLRALYIEEAGLHSDDAGAVFNGAAKTSILAALDYTPPPTLLPTATIAVDGSDADWAEVVPAIQDSAGDQKGDVSADLTQVSIAKSGDLLAVLMKVSGDFMFPYAPSSDFSHYEVALHFFANGSCLGESSGFMVVNNFASATGQHSHMVNNYFDGSSLGDLDTFVASSANVLETSFVFSGLPVDKGDYMSLTSAIHSFAGNGNITHDDNYSQKTCYKFR